MAPCMAAQQLNSTPVIVRYHPFIWAYYVCKSFCGCVSLKLK